MNILKEIHYQLRYALPIWLIQLLTAWLPDISIFIRVRGALVSLFLPGRPKNLTLGRDVTLLAINRLNLGDGVYIAKGSWINAIGGITFENEVVLAPYVVMSSNNHGFKDGSVKRGGAHPGPITIGFGTWIASHSVVAANVAVGKGNLVAANSVVTKSTPDNSVQAGVPAKHIKTRLDNPSTINSKHDIKL
ncbi:MAG: acyltransferase [Pseudoalteromonas distincta]|uniref:acyltransferase n=1 Tax=Pseudoalteromonas distincta TaxID=77608 RepID=UPI0030016421